MFCLYVCELCVCIEFSEIREDVGFIESGVREDCKLFCG